MGLPIIEAYTDMEAVEFVQKLKTTKEINNGGANKEESKDIKRKGLK